jgi:MFS family permease
MSPDRPDLTYDEPDGESDDRSASALDDRRDREELRQRHYGLLQELRVLLPGTQVLVAFLFTVPFNNRFHELDELDQDLYALALGTGALAIVSLITPTAIHRLGRRRARVARLVWSIRMARVGLLLMAMSLVASLTLVSRFVFGSPAAIVMATGGTAVILVLWVALPRLIHDRRGLD